MTIYADSSAVVKLYADESESDIVRSLPDLTASSLIRVEVASAIWRKAREHRVPERRALAALHRFYGHLAGTHGGRRYWLLAVSDRIVERASGLTGTFGLRAYDAVQLASGIAAREADPECTTFACFDADLRAAAATSGFMLIP